MKAGREQRNRRGVSPVKHPTVGAWTKWINSEEGKSCSEGNATGVYLDNRLWRAFIAGRESMKVI